VFDLRAAVFGATPSESRAVQTANRFLMVQALQLHIHSLPFSAASHVWAAPLVPETLV
jgi:hypothetical protein